MTYKSDLHDHDGSTYEYAAEPFLNSGRRKAIKSELEQLVDDEFNRLEEYAGYFISETAANRAERYLRKVLDGDKDAAMELLGSGNNSDRYRQGGYDDGKPWASLIHGNLFETDGIRMRRKLVEAHADLIASERIKDLESVVDGLTQQLRSVEADLERSRSGY